MAADVERTERGNLRRRYGLGWIAEICKCKYQYGVAGQCAVVESFAKCHKITLGISECVKQGLTCEELLECDVASDECGGVGMGGQGSDCVCGGKILPGVGRG